VRVEPDDCLAAGTGSVQSSSLVTVRGIVLGVAQTFGAMINPQGFLIAGHAVFLVVLAGRLAVGAVQARGGWHGLLARRS
jgi:branched-chain amino acid transport system permease protein